MANGQKTRLRQIMDTGSTAGILDRTLESLTRKGHLALDAEGRPIVTKRGKAWLAGRLGGSLPPVRKSQMRAHLRDRKPKKAPKAKGQAAKERRAAEADLRGHLEKQAKATDRAVKRILGGSTAAHGVKISRADGGSFTAADVRAFTAAGWTVTAAGSSPGRVGSGGLPGTVLHDDDFTFRNPEPLGPSGLARSLVLMGPVNREVVLDLVAAGYDVASAPKRIREGITRNPEISGQGKVYAGLKAAAKKGQALRVDELAPKVKLPESEVRQYLKRLVAQGLAHIAGSDLFGECYAAGVPQRGLFANPTGKAPAAKKAQAKEIGRAHV